MGFFSSIGKFFTGGLSGVIDSIGDAIDKNVTSDAERLALKNELEREMNNFKSRTLDHIESMDKEISDRHKNDMQSDSWLSKNVRPLTLVVLTATTMIFAYATTFADLTELQIRTLEGWLPLLQALLLAAYTFYYGGRSFEKYKGIPKDRKPLK